MSALSIFILLVVIAAIILIFLSFRYKDKPIFKFQHQYSGIISLVIGILGLIFTAVFVRNSILLYLFFAFDAAIGLIQLMKKNK